MQSILLSLSLPIMRIPRSRDPFQNMQHWASCQARTLLVRLDLQPLGCWTQSDLILCSHEAVVIGGWFDSANQGPGLLVRRIEIHAYVDIGRGSDCGRRKGYPPPCCPSVWVLVVEGQDVLVFNGVELQSLPRSSSSCCQ